MASVLVLACTREAVCGVVTDLLTNCNDHVEITYPNAPYKSNPLYDFPLLVKLAEDAPSGFHYSRVDPYGKDLRFLSVEGTASNAVPYEVDTWNTNGVSTLWVRVPKFSDKSDLKLVMFWAPDDPDALPANDARTVWNGYAGVWHLNGTAAESTTNAIASTAGAKASARTGIIGSALGASSSGSHGPIFQIPAGTPVDSMTDGAYTVTAWLKASSIAARPWLYSARTSQEDDAFGAEIFSDSGGLSLKLHADANTVDENCKKRFKLGEWVHLAVVHASATGKHKVFLNGVEWTYFDDRGPRTDKGGSDGFAFGGHIGASAPGTLNGDLDDVRIYSGALGQSWLTNEYAQVVSSDYVSFGAVSSTGKPVYVEEDDPDPEDPSPGAAEDVSPADYAGTAVFIPSGAEAGVVLTNFVTVIKVWDGEPSGFNPKNLPFGTEDIRFFDEQGNVLSFDIDTWYEQGESYFWVKVPRFSTSTRITMCWGLKAGKTLPTNDPKQVWSDYAGVWHLSDETNAVDGTAGTFGPNTVLQVGTVGKAAGTVLSGSQGAILDIEATEAIDKLTEGAFTVSGWVSLNKSAVKSGVLFSRGSEANTAWGAQFCGGTAGDSSRIEQQTGSSSVQNSVEIATGGLYTRFDFVYATDRLALYIDGELVNESVQTRTILNGTTGKLSIGSFVAAAEDALGANTLNGFIDEFRLRAGRQTEAERTAEFDQCDNEEYYASQPASWDESATLQNRWKVYPTAEKTAWDEGEEPTTFTLGEPWYGVSILSYQDRSTGEALLEMPTVAGDYRAIFTVPAVDRYSSLTYTIDFRIRMHRPSHDLGDGNDRILLLNSDQSISDGKVFAQSYSDTVQLPGRPYWVHDVDSGFDYTSTSLSYNFCGGLRHTYYARGTDEDRQRLWDLIDVRYGNTYNNADAVLEETGDWEQWEDGLQADMNYLAWNPQGGTLVDDGGLTAEGWHEYAAQAVLCNSLKASVNSGLYTNGIGTIYFDCVNSHTVDATNGYYRLVVEMATNALTKAEDPSARSPYGIPTDEAIAATQNNGELVTDPYKWADWKPLEMHVKVVNGTVPEEDSFVTNELELALAGGGSYTNFYRIYIPVDCFAQARFRIRRTAVNPDYTTAMDLRSLILVDNVICSKPTGRICVEPRGFYDETKEMRETVGYEGAFNPSYPSVSDSTIYARARARTQSGEAVDPAALSAVLMHYRWRYLDQQATDWLTADLDPKTLVSLQPISWPGISGDLEYWYEANQASEFYQYADYSGLDLGLPGYSEEILAVTGRAETYETEGRDWFTRIRDGKSTYGTIRLYVRRGETAPVESVEMYVARDRIWRGCLQTTNAVADGIFFRIEACNCQDDSLADFQFNTNYWYLSDAADKLPVAGSVIAGTTNDWGCVPCDAATGHIMFQLDEQSRALTVVHADWQDFNGWNDAHKDYFSGSSVEDSSKSGTSPKQREYPCACSQWTDDIATNASWTETFSPSTISGREFYTPFVSMTTPNGFDAGYGMWVPSAYSITEKQKYSYEQALQMQGQGYGFVQMTDPTPHPRGLESVRFSARIAQAVSPEDFAYYKGSKTESALFLDDYTFLTRAAFDLNANSNFTGNASLSLAAFYQPGESCYEARWEQIDGNIEDGSGTVLGPRPQGQRLVLYRWKYEGREWQATKLSEALNSDQRGLTWSSKYAPSAIPQAYSITNGLMPFCIGAYNNEDEGYTVIVAAIHVPGGTTAAENVKGNKATDTIYTLMNEKGWLYLVYRDTAAERLTSGTYGVLAANCEGVFVRPQYHEGVVSWKTRAETLTLATQTWPSSKSSRSEVAKFYNYASARECVDDFADGRWRSSSGRMEKFYETVYDNYNGFRACVVTQTVDIYTADIGTTSWQKDYEPVASLTLTGFGKPGVYQGLTNHLWSTDDSSVRLRAGGQYEKGVRTDVVVDNIQFSQWRGQNWFGTDDPDHAGPTNFVYTYGWVADGALELNPRRTPDHEPCSLRVPLCDGKGSTKAKRGLGLGSFRFRYRNAQTNACLLVQIATNGVSQSTLYNYTCDPGEGDYEWTTVTNYDFSAMTAAQRAGGVLNCSLGLHGVVGTLRLIVDPTLRDRVKDVTDPTAFGSVEITEALFKDEPALDQGCWWGFNIRTIGDVSDVEQRMYLPDNPIRSPQPAPLRQFGLSLALNNSITDGCDPEALKEDPNPFKAHMPFLQTPTFSSNVVGEVSFKARKYSLTKGAQCAEVTLYGTRATKVDDLQDKDWEILNIFIISNTTYETYRFKTDASAAYRAFRFAVTGVDGVAYPGPDPVCGDEPVRVLLDDVLVSEAIRARLAFRNVGAFRHDLSKTTYVADVPSVDEQPICKEGWGIQAEIYAAMLGEEIDETVPPRVRLHYYKGKSPWGFSQWRQKATSAWLTRASDTNGFYRSSASDSPDAVIPMSESLEYVQYMLEVVYTVVNSETGGRSIATNWLESTDWSVPSWYAPLDFNASLGGNDPNKFAAYSIIDEIAPRWAWINEINIFGMFDSNYDNSDRKSQFVEVAKPVESSLEGWKLRMLSAKNQRSLASDITTNVVATFGYGVSAEKSTPTAQNMSFIVVGNPESETTLSRAKGEYDGGWSFEKTDAVFNKNGKNYYLAAWEPVAIQLVRPSGIVEHEVAILGTNDWPSASKWAHSSSNLVQILETRNPQSAFFTLPDDDYSDYDTVGKTNRTNYSVGVYDSRGEAAKWWKKTMNWTPGRINEGQYINPDHPTPGGELILVFANVDLTFGRIVQTVGAGTNTTAMQTVSLKSESEAGLDIYYTVAPWCELGSVTETISGKTRTVEIPAAYGPRQYKVNVAKGASRNVTVLATATVDSRLRGYGLDSRNRYTPAVLSWLEGHTDAYGNDFYGWQGGETNDTIHLAQFLALSGEVEREMTLTEMYWLDMDPTASNMFFTAGMVRPPTPVVWKDPEYDPAHDPQASTNLRLGVYMAISNGNGRVKHDGKSVWAPYVLRGLGSGETSWDYTSTGSTENSWTSVTFKVTGYLNNGLTSVTNETAWIPLRYFVFNEQSFGTNFVSEIDVADPFSTRSPAYAQGWKQWVDEHGETAVFLSWNIDVRQQQDTAEVLAPTNRLDEALSP